MSIEAILKEVIEKLEKHEIEYMITGSFASNLHGVPRQHLMLILLSPQIMKN